MQIIMPKTARFFKMNNTYVNLAGCSLIELCKDLNTNCYRLHLKTVDGDSYNWDLTSLQEDTKKFLNPNNVTTFKRLLDEFISSTKTKIMVFDCTMYKLSEEQAKEYWENMWSED